MYPQLSTTIVEAYAPQVVGSFSPEEFDAPVYNQIDQEQIVTGMTTQHRVENPAVQEQVIVQEQVVGSLPPLEEFHVPVYNQIHQEQIVTGMTTQHRVENPAVQEQVIVQEQVVGSLPPLEEFPVPVYNQIHQEQVVAGMATQHRVENPAVQEQVIVQEIPHVSIVERVQERIVSSAPQVICALSPLEEFDAPVYNQIHQEKIIAEEITQHRVGNPAVQEQVFVHGIPQVPQFVDSFPPLKEFVAPMCNQVLQEQIVATVQPHVRFQEIPEIQVVERIQEQIVEPIEAPLQEHVQLHTALQISLSCPVLAVGVTAPPGFLSGENGVQPLRDRILGRPRLEHWALFPCFSGFWHCRLSLLFP